ncbi:GNAT family N-acetyltransferase [Paenisporosarcina antarctica]|uniref:GNAT family N-acetyltransferase n=1 Tax=Paenisporosarcina antarctica TaxID=417367 RepID=A0A4V1AMU7_9BACL|nr:GNAT family N-acetyltransferase [Paenisporosarcina antarctica]QBP40515.1 GNAT family N-acetyltransferase [Paenisporosarcina antarctica]
MKLSYQLLSTMSFQDAHNLFNRGFEGYFVPMNLSFDAYITRLGIEGLSPELSVVAFHHGRPVGFVLQGIREVDGQMISWNGGTGIIPEYRGKKLGLELMKEAESYLIKRGVSIATLEALSENKAAIKLYVKCGYEVVDDLYFLSSTGIAQSQMPSLGEYEIARLPAFQVIGSDLFSKLVPWQTDANSVSKLGGEAVIISKNGIIKGFCLIRKKQIYGKKLEGITLFQFQHTGDETAVQILLAHALEFDQTINRNTYNFPVGDGVVVRAMQANGFEKTTVSQVFMTKRL